MIGTDGFQETPIVEVTRQITKHNYLVLDLNDLPRIMKEVRAIVHFHTVAAQLSTSSWMSRGCRNRGRATFCYELGL